MPAVVQDQGGLNSKTNLFWEPRHKAGDAYFEPTIGWEKRGTCFLPYAPLLSSRWEKDPLGEFRDKGVSGKFCLPEDSRR